MKQSKEEKASGTEGAAIAKKKGSLRDLGKKAKILTARKGT